MTAQTSETGTANRARSIAALGAIGAGVGVGVFLARRRQRSPWDRARDRAGDLIDTAREQAKPWMGVAAGGAAAGTALAVYLRNRKRESGWQRAGRRAGEVAGRIGKQGSPWANMAGAAAVALASAAYANRARGRTIRGINPETAAAINSVAEKGARVLRRLRNISDDTRKLYPRLLRAMA